MMSARNALSCTVALAAGLLLSSGADALTLTEAWQRAGDVDPSLAAARAQRDADQELAVQERATRLPRISAVGTLNNTDTNVTKPPVFIPNGYQERYNNWTASVEARQALFRYDWWARGRRAEAREQQAELRLVQRQQAQMAQVAQRYLGVLQAASALAQAEADAGAVRRSLEDTRKRYEVQLVPGTDLKEAQARDDLKQAALLSARQSLATARDALDELVGSGDQSLAFLAADAPLPALAPADSDSWLRLARERNPGLLLARSAEEVARADVDSTRSDGLPTLDLVATHARQDLSDSRIGSKLDTTQVGVELRVPIFSSGAASSKLREMQARLRASQADRQRIERELDRNVRSALRNVQTTAAQTEAFHRVADSAQAAEQAVRYGYEAGKRTIADVLNAQSNTVQARRNLDQSRYDLLLCILQLKQQAGVLTPDDLAAIDRLLTPAL